MGGHFKRKICSCLSGVANLKWSTTVSIDLMIPSRGRFKNGGLSLHVSQFSNCLFITMTHEVWCLLGQRLQLNILQWHSYLESNMYTLCCTCQSRESFGLKHFFFNCNTYKCYKAMSFSQHREHFDYTTLQLLFCPWSNKHKLSGHQSWMLQMLKTLQYHSSYGWEPTGGKELASLIQSPFTGVHKWITILKCSKPTFGINCTLNSVMSTPVMSLPL